MMNQRGASKTDTVVKLVLVFFVSLLSFSIGTFVGKQVSDSDYRRAQLEQDYKGAREIASEDSEDKDGADKSLSEDDIKNLTEEFVEAEKGRTVASTEEKPEKHGAADKHEGGHEVTPEQQGYKKVANSWGNSHGDPAAETHPAAHAEPAHKAEPKANEHKPDPKSAEHKSPAAHAPEEAAQRVAAGRSPTRDEPQARKPNAILPTTVASSSIGKFTVQVASYAEEGEAREHAGNLKEKGWNAFYVPAEVKGRTWYRVNVGLFANSTSAKGFREKFMKEVEAPAAIVQKIVN